MFWVKKIRNAAARREPIVMSTLKSIRAGIEDLAQAEQDAVTTKAAHSTQRKLISARLKECEIDSVVQRGARKLTYNIPRHLILHKTNYRPFP